MDDEERSNLLAAMYHQSNDDEEEPKRVPPPMLQVDGVRKIRRMVIGAVSYEIPTAEYVAFLEQKIKAQTIQIEALGNDIRRLDANIGQLRNHGRQTDNRISNVNRSLDNKIDRRD